MSAGGVSPGERQQWLVEPAPRPAVQVEGQNGAFPVHRIYCVAQNYAEHAREMGSTGREKPRFFAKPADAVCLDRDIPYPPATANLHHEVELVIAIGRPGFRVSPEEAVSMVFGYAVGVDLTRRDLQAGAKEARGPWTTAKGFDRSAPVSPIRPIDACGSISDAAIALAVNGSARQQGTTADMIWNAEEVIAELSQYFELQAGDLVFTGTPAGVGPLNPGDRVEARIEGVGALDFIITPG